MTIAFRSKKCYILLNVVFPFWYWNCVGQKHTCWRHCLNLWVRAGETSPRSRWRWRRRAGIGATFPGFATFFYVPGSLISALVKPFGKRTLFNTITFQLWSLRGCEEGKPEVLVKVKLLPPPFSQHGLHLPGRQHIYENNPVVLNHLWLPSCESFC